MSVDPGRWQRVQELFYEAEAMGASARAAFLDAACAGDPDLRRHVEKLINASDEAGSFLEDAVHHAAGVVVAGKEDRFMGERIGSYRVVRRLGEGGMGAVFLAVRDDDQYHKEVAIKVVRTGLGSPATIERFRAERQILANLDHPHIARLLDGGVTDDSLPYVVMEYIDGAPVDRYCDERRLGVRDRLRLFQSVCSAVQYAHRNLIVHRDLKPGNILVTNEGAPKLLDFGIAKLLESGEAQPAATRLTERLMTPEYASPEQILGAPITTASDVYSLGVLLYELLTGRRPLRVTSERPAEVERIICDEEPEKPSTAVLRKDDAPATRQPAPPARLAIQLEGDLDNIVLMAIRKEPARRYASVAQFSGDIQRYLDGFPVEARKSTWSYRTAKFIRRHRLGVAAAALVALLIVGFGVGMAILARRIAEERDVATRAQQKAEHERQKAQRVSDFLVGLFDKSHPNQARGREITAREILDQGARDVAAKLRDQPDMQATMMDTVGRTYTALGLYDQAQDLQQQALANRERIYGGSHLEVAQSLKSLAELARIKSDYARSIALARRSLEIRRARLQAPDKDLADSMNTLALALQSKGDLAAAEPLYLESLDMRRRIFGPEGDEVAIVLSNLGGLARAKGDYAASEKYFRDALALRRKRLSNDHPQLAMSMFRLGMLLEERGEYTEAESLLRDCLAIRRKVLGPEHQQVSDTLNSLASVLQDKGDYAGAETLYRQSLEITRKSLGPESMDVAFPLNNLASLLEDKGDYAGAEKLFRESLAIRRKVLGGSHPSVARAMSNLARVLSARGQHKTAEAMSRESLDMRRTLLGEAHPDYASGLLTLAKVLEAKGAVTEAERRYRESLEVSRKALRAGNPSIALSLVGDGARRVPATPASAEAMLREALEIRRKALPAGHWQIAEAESLLGGCLLVQKRYAEAQSLLSSSYTSLKERRGERFPATIRAARWMSQLASAPESGASVH